MSHAERSDGSGQRATAGRRRGESRSERAIRRLPRARPPPGPIEPSNARLRRAPYSANTLGLLVARHHAAASPLLLLPTSSSNCCCPARAGSFRKQGRRPALSRASCRGRVVAAAPRRGRRGPIATGLTGTPRKSSWAPPAPFSLLRSAAADPMEAGVGGRWPGPPELVVVRCRGAWRGIE